MSDGLWASDDEALERWRNETVEVPAERRAADLDHWRHTIEDEESYRFHVQARLREEAGARAANSCLTWILVLVALSVAGPFILWLLVAPFVE